ncbi:MAG: tRNA-intron lyase [Candidatus Korarchaeota archaeon]
MYCAHLVGKSILILNYEEARRVYEMGYFGETTLVAKPRSFEFDSPLELSPYDALYLMEQDVLKVKNGNVEMSPEELKQLASSWIHGFNEKWIVYKDLRRRGFIVRSGLKFGGTFVVYRYGPGLEHAPFIVDVISGEGISSVDIVRAGRLATSVRKVFVIANVQDGKVEYFLFKWWGI